MAPNLSCVCPFWELHLAPYLWPNPSTLAHLRLIESSMASLLREIVERAGVDTEWFQGFDNFAFINALKSESDLLLVKQLAALIPANGQRVEHWIAPAHVSADHKFIYFGNAVLDPAFELVFAGVI
jgi:hypothetical protein